MHAWNSRTEGRRQENQVFSALATEQGGGGHPRFLALCLEKKKKRNNQKNMYLRRKNVSLTSPDL